MNLQSELKVVSYGNIECIYIFTNQRVRIDRAITHQQIVIGDAIIQLPFEVHQISLTTTNHDIFAAPLNDEQLEGVFNQIGLPDKSKC